MRQTRGYRVGDRAGMAAGSADLDCAGSADHDARCGSRTGAREMGRTTIRRQIWGRDYGCSGGDAELERVVQIDTALRFRFTGEPSFMKRLDVAIEAAQNAGSAIRTNNRTDLNIQEKD